MPKAYAIGRPEDDPSTRPQQLPALTQELDGIRNVLNDVARGYYIVFPAVRNKRLHRADLYVQPMPRADLCYCFRVEVHARDLPSSICHLSQEAAIPTAYVHKSRWILTANEHQAGAPSFRRQSEEEEKAICNQPIQTPRKAQRRPQILDVTVRVIVSIEQPKIIRVRRRI